MKWYKLNIKIPDDESFVRDLRLVDEDGKMYILCNSKDMNETLMKIDVLLSYFNYLL